MAVKCWIPNCRHNNFSHTCKFFKIPKDPNIRNKWLKLIKHVIEPKPYSAVCSCHFPEGKKENGPKNVPNNIKSRDKINDQSLTLQNSQKDLITSTEFHEFEDISSAQSSTPQDIQMVLTTETPAEIHEIKDSSGAQSSTSQGFEIIFKTEPPTEFYEIEDNSSEQNIEMELVTYTPAEFHEIEDNFNDQSSASQKFQMDLVTNSSAKIPKTEDVLNAQPFKSHETLSKSSKNNSAIDSKPPPSFNSIALLEAENYFLKKELEAVKLLHRAAFKFDYISDNKQLVSLYTGLPNTLVFNALYQLLENMPFKYEQGWKVEILTKKDQLFMTLMKIRQNFPNADLAFRFNVSKSVVSNVVLTWIRVLHEILIEQFNICNMNYACFGTFHNCRFVSNCAEMATNTQKFKSMQKQTLEPLNMKVLGKLWTELHQIGWNDKKKPLSSMIVLKNKLVYPMKV